MQVSVENTSALERRLTVQIPAQDIQSKVDSRQRELSKQVRIKGFRPGKVPMNVIRQRYGKQVHQEIVTEAMQNGLQEAIQNESLRPASMPRLEPLSELKPEEDLEFSAIVEIVPELETVDVSSLSVERPEAEVAESDIDDMLQTLRDQRTRWKQVEREPQEGDQVLVEYVAQTEEGQVPPKGHQRLAIVVGDSGFESLEKAVEKSKAGEEVKTKLAFPADYGEAALAGREADVKISIKSISEAQVPEVDEEFVKGFGIESGEQEDLRKEIRANLERELKQARTSLTKVTLINALIDSQSDLAVPESMVRGEAAGMARQASKDPEQDPGQEAIDAQMDGARRRVRGGLLMSELARQNGIRIDGARVREAIDTVAETYEEPDEVRQVYFGNQQLLQQIENAVLEEQVVDWVIDHADVKPRPMSFKEVIEEAARKR
jgi:trigger factor